MKEGETLSTGKIITAFGKKAILETTSDKGHFKIEFIANKSLHKKNNKNGL